MIDQFDAVFGRAYAYRGRPLQRVIYRVTLPVLVATEGGNCLTSSFDNPLFML